MRESWSTVLALFVYCKTWAVGAGRTCSLPIPLSLLSFNFYLPSTIDSVRRQLTIKKPTRKDHSLYLMMLIFLDYLAKQKWLLILPWIASILRSHFFCTASFPFTSNDMNAIKIFLGVEFRRVHWVSGILSFKHSVLPMHIQCSNFSSTWWKNSSIALIWHYLIRITAGFHEKNEPMWAFALTEPGLLGSSSRQVNTDEPTFAVARRLKTSSYITNLARN